MRALFVVLILFAGDVIAAVPTTWQIVRFSIYGHLPVERRDELIKELGPQITNERIEDTIWDWATMSKDPILRDVGQKMLAHVAYSPRRLATVLHMLEESIEARDDRAEHLFEQMVGMVGGDQDAYLQLREYVANQLKTSYVQAWWLTLGHAYRVLPTKVADEILARSLTNASLIVKQAANAVVVGQLDRIHAKNIVDAALDNLLHSSDGDGIHAFLNQINTSIDRAIALRELIPTILEVRRTHPTARVRRAAARALRVLRGDEDQVTFGIRARLHAVVDVIRYDCVERLIGEGSSKR